MSGTLGGRNVEGPVATTIKERGGEVITIDVHIYGNDGDIQLEVTLLEGLYIAG